MRSEADGAGRSCCRKRCPLQAALGHGRAELRIPCAWQTGSAWECPHNGHGSAIWHTLTSAVLRIVLFLHPLTTQIRPWCFKHHLMAGSHHFFNNFMASVFILPFGCQDQDCFCFTQHYVRKESVLFFCTWRPLSETGQCEVCSLMLNFKYLWIYIEWCTFP